MGVKIVSQRQTLLCKVLIFSSQSVAFILNIIIGHIPLKNLQKLRYPKSVQNVHLPASELDLTKLRKRGLICCNFHTFHTLNLATFS